jgi:hypothetical protein
MGGNPGDHTLVSATGGNPVEYWRWRIGDPDAQPLRLRRKRVKPGRILRDQDLYDLSRRSPQHLRDRIDSVNYIVFATHFFAPANKC